MSITDNQSEKREPVNISEVNASVALQVKETKFSAFRQASMMDLYDEESNSDDKEVDIEMN